MANLLQIGSSGLIAHQKLLSTTGNNIANVNTAGYSRQRNLVSAQVGWLGVDKVTTERIVSSFAQRELRIDTSAATRAQAYLAEVSRIDSLLSDESNAIGPALNRMFDSVQNVTTDPTSLTNRQIMLSQLQNMTGRFHSLSEQLSLQERMLDEQLQTEAGTVNSLIQKIYALNTEVVKANGTQDRATPELIDKRDEAVRELSEKLSISTVTVENGAMLVSLPDGQALVLEAGYSTISATQGDPDPSQIVYQLKLGNEQIRLKTDSLGGQVGGLFSARTEAIEATRRQIGQLALAMADAFNQQNRLGMDLDSELGEDLFSLPSVTALGFANNGDPSATITGSVVTGKGGELTAADFELVFTSATTVDIYVVENGVRTTQTPIQSETITGVGDSFEITGYGIAVDFDSGVYAAGDRFMLQPTRFAAEQFEVAITRPEDIALAAPIRLGNNTNNIGNGKMVIENITSTDPASSVFTLPGGLAATAPASVVINAAGDYEIRDGGGALLGTAPAASNGKNLMASAGLSNIGFEISIGGDVKVGDNFSIEFNTGGFNDNYNALLLAKLQTTDSVRKNVTGGGDNTMTLAEAAIRVVTTSGEKTAAARVNVSATQAKLDQSSTWHETISGVSLDEEAADLIKFEQAYNASARVISVAQQIFDTLLQAAG